LLEFSVLDKIRPVKFPENCTERLLTVVKIGAVEAELDLLAEVNL
jgi:hypothetical protein